MVKLPLIQAQGAVLCKPSRARTLTVTLPLAVDGNFSFILQASAGACIIRTTWYDKPRFERFLKIISKIENRFGILRA